MKANLWSATRNCRVANIVKEDGGEVWGALYKLSADLVNRLDGEGSALDRLEGHRTTRHPENYVKICVTVDIRDERRTAWTYIGLREAIERCERDHPGTACDPDYVETVISGGVSVRVPDRYLNVLRAALGAS